MSAGGETVVAFDVYGTLLSTESIAKKLASHFGEEKAQTIAAAWRKYQLEYTWRLNSMGQYEDFSKITRKTLQNALSESSVTLNDKGVDGLMEAYDSLSIFPDVAPALQALSKQHNIYPVVFSNGTHRMVSSSVNKSPELGQYASVFRDIVVVEEARRFKPAPEAYGHLAKKVGKDPQSREEMGKIWLVSGNPFDVVGARAVGLKACWIDRAGNGWVDQLVTGEEGRPTVTVKSLEEAVDTISKA